MFRWAAGLSGFQPRQRVPGIADASLTAEVPPAKAARGRRHSLLAQARGKCIALHAAGSAAWRVSNQHDDQLPPSVNRKSVVWEKSVSVRVDLGCRRFIKKKRERKHKTR